MEKYLIELGERAEAINNSRGYLNNDKSSAHLLIMVMTEFSELIEANRNDSIAEIEKFEEYIKSNRKDNFVGSFKAWIKGTIEEEIADIFIRLTAAAFILKYNISLQPLTVQGYIDIRQDIPNTVYSIMKSYLFNSLDAYTVINNTLSILIDWCEFIRVDFKKIIEYKLEYLEMIGSNDKKKY